MIYRLKVTEVQGLHIRFWNKARKIFHFVNGVEVSKFGTIYIL